jgi:hypothetical protein
MHPHIRVTLLNFVSWYPSQPIERSIVMVLAYHLRICYALNIHWNKSPVIQHLCLISELLIIGQTSCEPHVLGFTT